MNVQIILSSFLVIFSLLEISGTNAKQKSLKIIIPSKIRYVHHHHTHVVVMKDKKSHKERSPDAKFHHLHYYEDGIGGGRKSKGVNHHYYIPFLPPPAEDEAEDESNTKYTITPPKKNIFPKPNFISTRESPPPYGDQPYPSLPRKYRFYDKNSKQTNTSPRNVMEYYEASPYYPVIVNPVQDHATAADTKMEYQYQELIPFLDEEQLFYPEKSFYDNNHKFPHIY